MSVGWLETAGVSSCLVPQSPVILRETWGDLRGMLSELAIPACAGSKQRAEVGAVKRNRELNPACYPPRRLGSPPCQGAADWRRKFALGLLQPQCIPDGPCGPPPTAKHPPPSG